MLVATIVYVNAAIVSMLYVLMVAPIVLTLVAFADSRRTPGILRKAILWYGKCIIHVAILPFIRVRFQNFAPDEDAPGIYVLNHRSASDAFMVAMLNRPVAQVVNRWPMRLPFFGFFARRAGYLDIFTMSYEEFKSRVLSILSQGDSVLAFPEGTRSGSRKMNQFHSGVFRVAKELKCPIYPVCVVGSENRPDRRFAITPGVIKMRRMPGIMPEAYAGMSSFGLKSHVRAIIQAQIDRMEGTAA